MNPSFSTAVQQASAALLGVTVKTPLLENAQANERVGARLLLKAECLQRTGAFKLRGAFNRIRQMSTDELGQGVISYSSGNHALGLALAASLLKTNALIVMPADADPSKVQRVRDFGAKVAMFERDRENSDEVVKRLALESGRIVVPPSGNDQVLAGAGTVMSEILEQAAELDANIENVLVPCGGGGLTAASALVCQEKSPGTSVYAVEPIYFDDTARSLASGQREENRPGKSTICDAIMTPTPNAETFRVNNNLLAGGLVVTDDEVRSAMQFAFEHFGLIVEPGGAVGLAAVIAGKLATDGTTIATILTGRNIDPERYFRLLNSNIDRAGDQL